jgi:hypothetical protein
MGGFGWINPFPFEFGGSPTLVEVTYQALRANVGLGGSAIADETTIDGVWRQARASAIAAARAASERAVLQAFPGYADDALPYYEELFNLVPEDESNLVQRRIEAEQRYTAEVDSSVPAITAALQLIDPRFSIIETPHAEAIETILGRAFEDFAGTLPFGGGRRSTLFGNYSTEFVLFVLFDLGSGVESGPVEDAILATAEDYLNGALPTWVNFQTTLADGFILDESLLDVTGL